MTSGEMTPQIAMLLVIVGLAIVLFWWERIPVEVTALGVLLSLVFVGLLPAKKAFDGFGSDAVIMILGLLILTAAMERTGVVDIAGRALLGSSTMSSPDRLWWTIMLASAILGAFISNTASTAFFLPIVFGVARKSGVSATRFLMPMAFASILTSSVTLVSTSTNMVVSGMMSDFHLPPMGMFELAPVGIPISIVGLVYLGWTRRFIPEHRERHEEGNHLGVRPYYTEVRILRGSPLVGKTVSEARTGRTLGLKVRGIEREEERIPLEEDPRIEEGDVLLVEGVQTDIVKVKDTPGLELKADAEFSGEPLADGKLVLAEAIIMPGSSLIGRTLRESHIRKRRDIQVLGVNREGFETGKRISRVRLRLGDVLLVQGHREVIAQQHEENNFEVLGPLARMEKIRPKRGRAAVATGIFALVLALTSLEILTLPVAAMFGVLLVFLTGCITPQEAYAAVEWKAIILIGSMLGLGTAMQDSGAAAYLAGRIVEAVGDTPIWLLTGFFVVAVVLTAPLSNQAAAIVIMPVALATATHAGLNPRSFAMMIAVASSTSYMTPLEPACVLVYGPGRYRFSEFVKLGTPLTVLIYLVSIALVPLVWPLGATGK